MTYLIPRRTQTHNCDVVIFMCFKLAHFLCQARREIMGRPTERDNETQTQWAGIV